MVAAGSCLGIHSQAGDEESGVRSQEKNGCGGVSMSMKTDGKGLSYEHDKRGKG